MIPQEDLMADEAGTLDPERRRQLGELLARDEEALRYWLVQRQMDEALRVVHDRADSRSRLRRSIIEVASGADRDEVRRNIMRVVTPSPARRRAMIALGTLAGAAACVLVAMWLTATDGIATVAAASGATVARAGVKLPVRPGFSLKTGDELSVAGAAASGATIGYRDATHLVFGPGSRVRLGLDDKGGKQAVFLQGSLTARVSKQPARAPLTILTPQALVTVIGTEFTLAAEARTTELQVSKGVVRMARPDGGDAVEVAAGQSAVFLPGSIHPPAPLPGDTRGQGLNLASGRRRAFLWPFAPESDWNRAIGSAARYEPVNSTGFAARAPLANVVTGRPIFLEVANFPVHQLFVNGEVVRSLRISDKLQPGFAANWPVIILVDPSAGRVIELRDANRGPSGDLSAKAFSTSSLRGAGERGLTASGHSALGGVIRYGELTRGIPHAIAVGVKQEALEGNLQLGTWLAIPPSADLTAFSGPTRELARALQDYGACVTDTSAGPFTLFVWYENIPPGFASSVGMLLPLLQVVDDRTAGTLRRPDAPPLQDEP